MPVLRLLLFQDLTDLPQCLFRIYDPGRIVGRVDDHRLCVYSNRFAQRLVIHLECFHIRRDDLEHRSVVLHKIFVFGKIRRNGNDLTALFRRQRLDHTDQCGSCSAGEKQISASDRVGKPTAQNTGYCLPNVLKTRRHGISVQRQGVYVLRQLPDGLIHLFRSRNAGVSQRIIIHIFTADLFGLLQSICKQRTNDRRLGTDLI